MNNNFSHLFSVYYVPEGITFNRLSHWNHSVTLWNGQITIILLRRKIWRLRVNKTYYCMCVYKPCRMENSGKLFSKTAPCMICTCTLRSQAWEFKPYTVKILTPFTIFLHYTKIFILFQLHNKGLDEAHSILMSMTLQKNMSLEKLLPTFLWNLQSVCWKKMCWFQFMHTGNLGIKHHHTLEHLLQFCPLKDPLKDTSSTTWLIASLFQCLDGAHSGGEMNSAGWLPLYLLAPPSTVLSFVLHTLRI